MDFIEEAFLEYEERVSYMNDGSKIPLIKTKESVDKITLLIKDLYFLKLRNRRSYPLNILLHLLNKNFKFNGFNIEIEEILFNSETKKHSTTVRITIKNDGTFVTGTSTSETSVKKSITLAIKICILYEFEKLYNNYINNQ